MKLIFVSGKYRAKSEWELEQNIRHAQDAALRLWQQGYAVICPHLNSARFGGACHDSVWLEGDLEMLKRCDAIYMLTNWQESEGAKQEIKLAKSLNKEILFERGTER